MMNQKQALDLIIEKFSNVDSLGVKPGYNDTGLTYSPTLASNGIGCGIGCLLTTELADELEEYCAHVNAYPINILWYDKYNESESKPPILEKLFKDELNGLSIEFLAKVQFYHDQCSRSPEEYVRFLKANYDELVVE